MSKVNQIVSFPMLYNYFEVGILLKELLEESRMRITIENHISGFHSHLDYSEVTINASFYSIEDKMHFDTLINKIIILNNNERYGKINKQS